MFRKKLFSVLVVILACGAFSSCIKKDFETPPDPALTDPDLHANTTIAALKEMDSLAGIPIRIVDDLVISGIVVADDKSGNFYKELVIQDETGGISIQIDQSDYYKDFPVGRRVFIKLRDLWLGEYHHLIQLGGYYTTSGTYFNIERIPQTLVSQHIIKGSYYHTVTPVVTSIFNLSKDVNKYQNMLVQVEDVEFQDVPGSSYINLPYANGPNLADVNMVIEDCCNNELELRTSDFADFGYQLTPAGKGSMTGIFQIYDSYNQIKIRDLSDVKMNGLRCGVAAPKLIGTGSLMDVKSIRNLFSGCAAAFTNGTKVRGTVTSDLTTANINSYNLVMQDELAGIVVRFYSNNTFDLNDSIEIDLSGDSLTAFNGLLQISSVDLTDVTVLGTGNVAPINATVDEIYANTNNWESMLVRVENVTFPGSGVYSGSISISDPTGFIDLYTRSGATFAGSAYPSSGTHSVTAYVNIFNGTPELNIRSTADVQ